MWYVISGRKGAKIMAGMNPRCTKRQVVENMQSPEIEKYLQVFPSVPGDAYFISAGTLHAIGEGNLLLEIQQNSDTTYRVSDWGRVDDNGQSRELHVDKAMKSINFVDRTSPRISGVSDTAAHNRKFPVINRCPFFAVDDYRLVEDCPETTAPFKSFHMLSAINRPVRVSGSDKTVELAAGDTCLVPACFGSYTISPLEQGESIVIKTTIQ
jgi:mannose-6-phosphate isomerase